MTNDDKRQLVKLLNIYQDELLIKNNTTFRNYNVGIKSQYKHARCISNKLSVELEKEIQPRWY